MSYLVWSEERYACGIREIDEQHKQLIEALNELLSGMKEGRGTEELGRILSFLEGYVVNHFSCEERHMQRLKCTACNANKAAHEEFLRRFAAIKETCEGKGISTRVVLDVETLLCDWLDQHIARVDTKLRAAVEV
ncbi:MAG: bacteriohemerythrin [Phycisphaerae bacterium]